jgi:hypothetical protein
LESPIYCPVTIRSPAFWTSADSDLNVLVYRTERGLDLIQPGIVVKIEHTIYLWHMPLQSAR